VKIDLIVRGICSLRPRLPGISDTITVRSVVDRFLEHSRIFYFQNAAEPGGQAEIYVGSADWMPRNFFRRIEAVFPIEDRRLRTRIKDELLDICMNDNAKAWTLQADGAYRREGKSPVLRRSQTQFMKRACK
jgi:polyphosphate kinase